MQQYHSPIGSVGASIPREEKQATSLDISIGEMDGQLSRFYNATNRLDVLSDRLKRESPSPLKSEPKGEVPMSPTDHCGKLEHQNGVFNGLNNRLEGLVETLSRII